MWGYVEVPSLFVQITFKKFQKQICHEYRYEICKSSPCLESLQLANLRKCDPQAFNRYNCIDTSVRESIFPWSFVYRYRCSMLSTGQLLINAIDLAPGIDNKSSIGV